MAKAVNQLNTVKKKSEYAAFFKKKDRIEQRLKKYLTNCIKNIIQNKRNQALDKNLLLYSLGITPTCFLKCL